MDASLEQKGMMTRKVTEPENLETRAKGIVIGKSRTKCFHQLKLEEA